MKNWKMVGNPFCDRKEMFSYAVTVNQKTKKIKINSMNMRNAGALTPVEVGLNDYQQTGLPEVVKHHIKKHENWIRSV